MTMNRRGFFGLFATGAVASTAVVLAPPNEALPITSSVKRFDGWAVSWTGWKPIYNMDIIVGQWIARAKDSEVSLFSSCPGAAGYFTDGQLLDVSIRKEQLIPKADSSKELLFSVMEQGLERLKKVMELAGPPPLTYAAVRDKNIWL